MFRYKVTDNRSYNCMFRYTASEIVDDEVTNQSHSIKHYSDTATEIADDKIINQSKRDQAIKETCSDGFTAIATCT